MDGQARAVDGPVQAANGPPQAEPGAQQAPAPRPANGAQQAPGPRPPDGALTAAQATPGPQQAPGTAPTARASDAPAAPKATSAGAAPAAAARPVVHTVSGLQRLLRSQLEERHPLVLVAGEISNLQINARSGHAYFTLKDDAAQIKCVLWRDQLVRVRHRLDDGLQVVVRARVTIYEQGGQLQLSVQQVDPQGVGARQLEYRERVEKLRREGLTADARKRPLPPFPRVIGVVTSASGAALRDVLRTILRRDPFAHVIIASTPVQGDEACPGVVHALRQLDALGRCEVLLLVRGGGSIEDLWCFNEEAVARQIVATSVPVVTGIGHETDTTIADLVADLRASTPTAAAEHAVPIRSEVRQRVRQLEQKIHRALLHRIEADGRRLLRLSARLRDPSTLLARRAQRLDDLQARGERAIRARLATRADATRAIERRLARLDPKARIAGALRRNSLLEGRAAAAIGRLLTAERHALAVLVHRLESLSPLAVLARGYALARTPDGALVKDAARLSPGDALTIRVAAGELEVVVTEIHAAPQG